jgi:hypothetical protein
MRRARAHGRGPDASGWERHDVHAISPARPRPAERHEEGQQRQPGQRDTDEMGRLADPPAQGGPRGPRTRPGQVLATGDVFLDGGACAGGDSYPTDGYPAGGPSESERIAWLWSRCVPCATFYVNTVGRGRRQMLNEARLREAIEEFLDRHAAACRRRWPTATPRRCQNLGEQEPAARNGPPPPRRTGKPHPLPSGRPLRAPPASSTRAEGTVARTVTADWCGISGTSHQPRG